MLPMTLMAIAAVGQLVTGVGAGMQQKQAVQDQRRAQRQQTAMEVERNKKAAIQTIREARIRRAMIEASAVNTGARGSGEQGSIASIQSQAGASVGFQRQQAQNAVNITNFLDRSASSQSKAATYGAASNQFSNLFAFGQGLS